MKKDLTVPESGNDSSSVTVAFPFAMTWVRRLALPGFILMVVEGCGSSARCPCPFGGAEIDVSVLTQDKIAAVSADSCEADISDQKSAVFLRASSETTCHVTITLSMGEVLTSSVQFASLGGCCAATFGGTATAPAVVDGGSRD